ncbi:MAG: DUF4034 domain-containing protein [Sulfurovum sp.]|nr:DUF4034 domain-containing protein [Sulfurovum sp.]
MKKIVFVVMLLFGFSEVLFANLLQDKAYWIQLLEDKKYNILEEKLNILQVAYENDASRERKLLYALTSFKNSDPLLENKLALWLREKPDSIFSHLAYGMYHVHLGWLSRGSRWSTDTTSQQFAKMRGHFREAKDQLTWVVDKNPKLSIAYAGLISVETAVRVKKKQLFEEAIKHNPLSSVIRTTYLVGLLPKWGGSYKEIEDFLGETSTLYSKNPALSIQDGFLEYAQGDKIFTSDENNAYEKALKYFDRAISKSNYTKYINRRAQVYRYMKLYKKSIEDYTKALEMLPQDSELLEGRAKVYYKLKQYDFALSDVNKAILYDKMNPKALQTRGLIYYKLKHKDHALLDLTDSLVYGYENKTTHTYIGYIHYYTKKNYRLAAESLKKASEFGNKKSHIWYLITASQWHNRDCEFVKSADIYAQKCKKSKDCKKKNLDWALKSAAFARKSTCKK